MLQFRGHKELDTTWQVNNNNKGDTLKAETISEPQT